MEKLHEKGLPVPKPIFLSTTTTTSKNKIGLSFFIREFVEVSTSLHVPQQLRVIYMCAAAVTWNYTKYIYFYNNHVLLLSLLYRLRSSAVTGDRGKRTSDRVWTRDLRSSTYSRSEFQPHKHQSQLCRYSAILELHGRVLGSRVQPRSLVLIKFPHMSSVLSFHIREYR